MSDDLFEALAREWRSLVSSRAKLPVGPRVRAVHVREHLARYDFNDAVPLGEVVADVAWMLRRWMMHPSTPRQMGLFNPPAALASVAADALVAMFNPQLAVWASAPAAVEMEQHTLSAFARCFGWPPDASRHFTSGGAESNLTAVVLALAHRSPASVTAGLRALGAQPVIYASAESHGSIRKAATTTGVGQDFVRLIPCDDRQRIDLERLDAVLAEDRARGLLPAMLVGTAGTTATGAIDPLHALADRAVAHGLWFHVDAAYGGIAALSPHTRPSLDGIERADSFTCDAHKGVGTSMGAGMFFTRHGTTAAQAFAVHNGYMPLAHDPDRLDPYRMTLQWSRRFIGLKAFVTLANQGIPGLSRQFERQCARAESLRAMLVQRGWRLRNETPLPIVCFDHPALDGALLGRVASALQRTNVAWVSEVRVSSGWRSLRAGITHPDTSDDDLRALCDGLDALRARHR